MPINHGGGTQDKHYDPAKEAAKPQWKKAKNPKYNEYKPWSDVLRYVKPEVKKGAGANAPRDIHDRFVTELTKLYKAGKADENPTEATLDATYHIGMGLEKLGIDLTQFNLVD